jgi:poly-gamma-glutamate synthesis protein (capsule biosynthesis protein)
VAAVVLLVTGCSGQDRPVAEPAAGIGTPESGVTFHDVLPDYTASVQRIGPDVAGRMTGSHHAGCPVPLDRLRYVNVRYLGLDGRAHLGELVVHQRYARDISEVFGTLYRARFPIERMQLVDDYGGDDDVSMAADNTSAYNCRTVAGTDRWSNHAFGAAIDINPVLNPYVQGEAVDPPAGARFAHLDRSAGARVDRGVITDGDVVVRAFAGIGWEWGGHWRSSKDYQHFAAGGG